VNNLTLLETILIIYIIVINMLWFVTAIVDKYASKKVSEVAFYIWFGVVVPITLPIVIYLLTFDKWKRRKSKQDLEKQFDENIKENDK